MKLHDTDTYVIIDSGPKAYPPELRWLAIPGTVVRVREGLVEGGQTGVIVGEARSRKADRRFNEKRERAVAEKRPMTEDDYKLLVDAEGPLVLMDSGALGWHPGQCSSCLEPVS